MAAHLLASAKMSVAIEALNDEMAEAMRRLAWPSRPGESTKSCQRRVQRTTADFLSPGQVRRLWERRWKWVPAVVADELRLRVEEHERRVEAQLQNTKAEYSRVWALVHQSSDPEFYSSRLPEGSACAHPHGRKTDWKG